MNEAKLAFWYLLGIINGMIGLILYSDDKITGLMMMEWPLFYLACIVMMRIMRREVRKHERLHN